MQCTTLALHPEGRLTAVAWFKALKRLQFSAIPDLRSRRSPLKQATTLIGTPLSWVTGSCAPPTRSLQLCLRQTLSWIRCAKCQPPCKVHPGQRLTCRPPSALQPKHVNAGFWQELPCSVHVWGLLSGC